jgi:hypothetical protein
MIETCDLYPDVKMYPPQLVGKCPFNDVGELSYSKGWLASLKVDGYWQTLIKENNQVYMFARAKSKKTGFYTMKVNHMPHIKQWAMETLPNGTTLIGEVYIPGGTSKDITSILGCLEEKAIARQEEYGYLHFYIHDILQWAGKDFVLEKYPYICRYSELCSNVDLNNNKIPQIEVAGIYDSIYIDFNSVLNNLFENNEEGLVFRTEEGLYLPGKRTPKNMFKVKQETNDIDAVIMECEDPEKLYTGKCIEDWPYWEGDIPVTKPYALGYKNAFKVGLYSGDYLIPIATVASGLDDSMRQDMGLNPNKYIGQVVQLQAMSVDKDKMSLRHPRFVQLRPDKNASECTIDTIF